MNFKTETEISFNFQRDPTWSTVRLTSHWTIMGVASVNYNRGATRLGSHCSSHLLSMWVDIHCKLWWRWVYLLLACDYFIGTYYNWINWGVPFLLFSLFLYNVVYQRWFLDQIRTCSKIMIIIIAHSISLIPW